MSTEQSGLFFDDNIQLKKMTPESDIVSSHKILSLIELNTSMKLKENYDETKHAGGRPRKYQTRAERDRAYYLKKKQSKMYRANFTGQQEWYTPSAHIDAVRAALGTIDLDPATSEGAQQRIQAGSYYTEKENGLIRVWRGNVYLNPPYNQPLIEYFITRLVDEFNAQHVSAAILLTHNSSDTKWFSIAKSACTRICLTTRRIQFEDPQGKKASPTQGQCFFYFGPQPERFTSIFSLFGNIMTPER